METRSKRVNEESRGFWRIKGRGLCLTDGKDGAELCRGRLVAQSRGGALPWENPSGAPSDQSACAGANTWTLFPA